MTCLSLSDHARARSHLHTGLDASERDHASAAGDARLERIADVCAAATLRDLGFSDIHAGELERAVALLCVLHSTHTATASGHRGLRLLQYSIRIQDVYGGTVSEPTLSARPQDDVGSQRRNGAAGALQDAAREEIKRQILTGKLGAGTLLSEESLASELSMSRTPVRQAMQQLVSLGLLERFPGRGVMVSHVDLSRMRSIVELQECLLAWCLPRLCAHPSAKLGPAMEAYEDQRDALARGDRGQIIAAARRMDVALVSATGNAEMARVMREISDLLLHAAAQVLQDDHDYTEAIAEHGAILDAVKQRDPGAVDAALATHCSGIRQRLVSGGRHAL